MAKRTPTYVPHQSKFSVQDVRDYSTPAGSSMANEEMRRLKNVVNKIAATATAGGGTGAIGASYKPATGTTTPTEPQTTTDYAFTVKHNGVVLPTAKKVQVLNFIDDVIKFDLSRLNNSNQNEVSLSPATEVDIKATLEVLTGDITINQLPLDPATMPSGTPTSELYKYENYTYCPPNKYGWYVYKVLNHQFNLLNKNDYILQLIDLHLVDYTDFETDEDGSGVVDELDQIIYESIHFNNNPQRSICEHEGLDGNSIIIRAVCKPDLHDYYGGMYSQNIELIDEDNRIARTNLNFRYILIKGE